MNIKDLDAVNQLVRQFRKQADEVRAIQKIDEPTMYCYARSIRYDTGDIPLMPVTKEVVLSAAKRELSKTVAALQSLGVTVDVESFVNDEREAERAQMTRSNAIANLHDMTAKEYASWRSQGAAVGHWLDGTSANPAAK